MSPNAEKNKKIIKRPEDDAASIIPQSSLKKLKVSQIKPSSNNPRLLFDPVPLSELKENIRQHGVLVPITVYEVRGQNFYAILDGQRRYQCCVDLEKEGKEITIPANIVDPPNKIAGLLFMFSIHNFREQWELMPTALSLKVVMEALGEQDSEKLSKLTGLSQPQVERCKILLNFPEKFQELSLDPDPTTRIPSNFWIEANPILDLTEETLPTLTKKLGRDGITDKLVEKYRGKRIKSVIHFRRITEAYELSEENKNQRSRIIERLDEYITNPQLETRAAFDEFVVDNRRIQTVISACDEFISQIKRAKVEHVLERNELMIALNKVKNYIEKILQKLEGSDQPDLQDTVEDE